MSGRRMGLAAVLACCLALPASSAAARSPPLSVDFIRANAAQGERGGTLPLSGRVSNTGDRARHPKVKLSLRGGAIDASLGTAELERLRGHSRLSFDADGTVPRRIPGGRYWVVACVRRRCTSSKDQVRVAVADRSSGPSSNEPPTVSDPPPVPPVVTNTVYVPIGPPAPPPADFRPGARTGGDVLFPQIGNGGYDAAHYDVLVDYTPSTRLLVGQTTMEATATQDLSELSLDLQGFDVLSVLVDGRPAQFRRELPAAASAGAEHIASKLVITPQNGLRSGSAFTVAVFYSGVPETMTDPDGSQEGWFFTDTGGAVVCQPIGCQGVFPSNNVPYDKATFDETIVVPEGMTGIGNGSLVSSDTASGRTTWRWHQAEPISTYLTTTTVGTYDLARATDPLGHEIYNFTDTAANAGRPPFTPAQLAGLQDILGLEPDTVAFLTGIYGPFPFGSYGAIVANAPNVGYALEVATKPFYPSAPGDPYTHTHELLHQWIGDSVTYRQIRDMWIHEGMATWIEWYWGNQRQGDAPTSEIFDEVYDDPATDWSLPPALPEADTLFSEPVYLRGGLTYEALRQIVGDDAFFRFLRTLYERYEYSSIGTDELIAVAEEVSGRDLDAFFAGYLYTPGQPPRPDAYGALAAADRSDPNTRTSARRSPTIRGQTRLAR